MPSAAQARLALRGAADRAAALGAYDQAATHLQQALDVTTGGADRADLLERLAQSSLGMDGRYAPAIDAARSAVDAHRRSGHPETAARVAASSATGLIDSGRFADAAAALAEALPAAGSDPELRATLLAGLSRAHMRARHGAAIEAADQALAIAEPRAMITVLVEALNAKAAAMDIVGRWRSHHVAGGGAALRRERRRFAELNLRS